MSENVNLSALNKFNAINLGNDNAIAKLDERGAITLLPRTSPL